MAETLKVLLVAVTAALQHAGAAGGGEAGASALMRVLLPLLVQSATPVEAPFGGPTAAAKALPELAVNTLLVPVWL